MVLIIKKFVKVFSLKDNVPKKYLNLRKSRHVKTFLKPYPNIPEILVSEYGLKWNQKIIVFHTKKTAKRGWKNYRTPFKKIYYGTVKDFKQHILGFLKDMRKKAKRKNKHSHNSKPRTVYF